MGLKHLFIYSHKGRHLLTIMTNHTLYDATWTPCGNIVFTTSQDNKVGTMLKSFGKAITVYFKITEPKYLSVSNDDVIFVVIYKDGVFQSTDDGFSWSFVFKPPGGFYFFQVIKVTTDNNLDFWTLVLDNANNVYLLAYSVNKSSIYSSVTLRDIKAAMKNNKNVDLSKISLLYDGYVSIFLCETDTNVVYVLSENDRCYYQLPSPHYIMHKPWKLAVDKKSR